MFTSAVPLKSRAQLQARSCALSPGSPALKMPPQSVEEVWPVLYATWTRLPSEYELWPTAMVLPVAEAGAAGIAMSTAITVISHHRGLSLLCLREAAIVQL